MLANLENYAQNLIRIIGNSRNSMPDLRNSRTRLGAEMRHSIISTLAGLTLVAGLVAPLQAEDAQGPELVDNPPERHVVVKGDTLWGISKRFLKDPWRWPDIWGLNKDQVRNPHLIYPGNVILLDLSGASPRLRLEADGPGGLAEAANGTSVGGVVKLKPKVRSQQLTAAAIPSIPASVIEPFLNRPLIISTDQFDNAPRIVATPESRVLASQGDPVYVKGVPPSPSTVWQVYRRSKVLMDPLSGEELGFEVIYLGDTQLQAFADVTTMKILRAAQEIGVGDRLVEAPPSEVLAYAPPVARKHDSGPHHLGAGDDDHGDRAVPCGSRQPRRTQRSGAGPRARAAPGGAVRPPAPVAVEHLERRKPAQTQVSALRVQRPARIRDRADARGALRHGLRVPGIRESVVRTHHEYHPVGQPGRHRPRALNG